MGWDWWRCWGRRNRRLTQQTLQPINSQTLGCKQLGTDAGISADGDDQLGHINRAIAPATSHLIGGLQQLLEVLTDEQLITARRRLIRQHILQAIEKIVRAQRQRIHPATEG